MRRIALSAAQRELLEARRRAQRQPRSQAPRLTRTERSGPAPLSFAQRRIWMLEQMLPEPGVYNVPTALRLRGQLDPERLESALGDLVARHDVLRTRFEANGGEPVQIVEDRAGVTLERVHLGAGCSLEDVREAAIARAREPFDLRRAPLVRAHLFSCASDEHVLLLVTHHIVSDGWSLAHLLRELGERLEDDSRPLDAPPLRFADYARWERERVDRPEHEAHLRYWRERLEGAQRPLHLPADRPRPPAQTHRGDWTLARLPASLAGSLRELSRRENASLYMTLLAAFEVLLHRYTGETDIRVGTPVANRDRPELEALQGVCINTLVMREDLSDAPTFRQLLGRVRGTALEALDHAEVPFEKLVEELAPDRDPSTSPLVQTLFVMQNQPAPPERMAGLEAEPLFVHTRTAKVDLTLMVYEEPGGELTVGCEHATDLFDGRTIEHLMEAYRALLEGAAAHPERRVGELPLLSEAGRAHVVEELNATAHDFGPSRPLHAHVEAQVDRSPDAVAVTFEGRRLSYAELDARANRVAHALAARGVGRGDLVGVCLERSLELPVAVLGVLKAGAAYVPLDPSYPARRLAQMVEDCRRERPLDVVLTQAPAASGLREELQVETLAVDDAALDAQASHRPGLEVDPDDLAYVIFTSGSTGRPKGAMNTHRAVENRLLWMQRQYGLSAADRVLHKTPYSFDVSVWELLWPPMTGARMVVARPEGHRDPGYLARVVAESGVTVMHFVPSMLGAFVDAPGAPACARSLRQVVCSGEALPPSLCERFFERLPGVALDNLYGPTEAAVDVTRHRCEPGAEVVPIGRPIANTRIYVLDARQQPVPVGVPGELYIGGVQVARGYVGRPGLTAERFVPSPFGDGPLYRTGDAARWRSDGTLEYLGRLDGQVKVRGQRIELAEVEAALLEHDAVREAVVTAREDRLVAYVAADADAAGLRQHLRQRLPDFMVPAAYVALDALPRLRSGKIDRSALPAPDLGAGAGEAHVPPRGPTEEMIADAWREVLDLRGTAIGVRDDFFDLGGHSLLATQVVARIRDLLGVEVPLQGFFAEPTVEALAARVETGRGVQDASPPIARRTRSGPVPLSTAQQRLWILEQMVPPGVYNVPTALRIDGSVSVETVQRALGELTRRHETLRTRFGVEDGQPVQIVLPRFTIPLEITDLRDRPGEREARARRLASAEARRPFDLSAAPPVRAHLYRLTDDRQVLLLVTHHLLTDGWSEGLLRRDLEALLEAPDTDGGRGREASTPPEPAVQYADFALWQRERMSEPAYEQQLAYWKRQLAGELEPLQLPTDRPRPAVQSFNGECAFESIPETLAERVRELARNEGTTPFAILLGAFKVLLHRYTGQGDLRVGTPIAGRRHREVEDVVGMFVNTLVLRTQLDDGPTFRELVRRVREVSLEAFAHQDVPFERVVEEIAPEREPATTPVFQVAFVHQNSPTPAGRERGGPRPQRADGAGDAPTEVRLERGFAHTGTSKFELTLLVDDEPDGSLRLGCEYNSDLFDGSTVHRLLSCFSTLLRSALDAPEQPVSELPMLPPHERTLLESLASIERSYPHEPSVHAMIERQVDRGPERTALVDRERTMSYGELERRANRLANHLRARGLGREDVVAVVLEPCADQIVGPVGVLKSGAAFLPIDGDLPPSRIAAMIEDSGAKVVLTHARLADRVPADRPVLRLDDGMLDEGDAGRPAHVNGPSDLAYVIYTSGSTGRPKGVMVEHRNLINHCYWHHERFGITEQDRGTKYSAFGFDGSCLEVFPFMTRGASLFVVPGEIRLDMERLSLALEENGVTVVGFFTTPIYDQFRRQPNGSLRMVLTGGDKLHEVGAHDYRVFNVYGPTENTILTTTFEVESNHDNIPIGHPVANHRCYVLDARLQPVPVGVPGELYVGGAGVARGYLGRPEQTAERFVADPFRPDERMYRTGDRVRWRPDGELEFLGRADHQVKVCGVRIELGEIEMALREQAEVAEAAVVAQPQGRDRALVGYVVPEAGRPCDPTALREGLASRLPPAMVPSVIMALDALPLTPNGKLDVRALPEAEPAAPEGSVRTAPRTPIEATLAEIWSEVLGIERPDVHANFFDLGGHSLHAIQVIDRLHKRGLRLTAEQFFQLPTIAGLATVASTRRTIEAGDDSASLVTLQPRGQRPPLYLLHSAPGDLLGYGNLVHHLDADQPCYGFQSHGLQDPEARHRSLEDMAAHYVELLTSFQPAGPYQLAGWCFGGTVALEMAQQLRAAGHEVAPVILFEVRPSRRRLLSPSRYPDIAKLLLEMGPRRLLSYARAKLGHVRRDMQAEAREAFALDMDTGPLAHRQQVYEANLEALRHYRDRYYPGRVVLFRATDDDPSILPERDYGWSSVAAEVELEEIPGRHESILKEPEVRVLADRLRAHLRRAQRDGRNGRGAAALDGAALSGYEARP